MKRILTILAVSALLVTALAIAANAGSGGVVLTGPKSVCVNDDTGYQASWTGETTGLEFLADTGPGNPGSGTWSMEAFTGTGFVAAPVGTNVDWFIQPTAGGLPVSDGSIVISDECASPPTTTSTTQPATTTTSTTQPATTTTSTTQPATTTTSTTVAPTTTEPPTSSTTLDTGFDTPTIPSDRSEGPPIQSVAIAAIAALVGIGGAWWFNRGRGVRT